MSDDSQTTNADESSARRRGRPREFDPEAVLREIVAVFWKHGYDGRVTDEILDRTGLSRSSLYGAFGSKDDMFQAALSAYVDEVSNRLIAPLADSDGASISDFADLVDSLTDTALVAPDLAIRGCLVVNSVARHADTRDDVNDAAANYLTAMKRACDNIAQRAVDDGLAPDDADGWAALLLTSLIGLNVLLRRPESAPGQATPDPDDTAAAIARLLRAIGNHPNNART